MGAKLLSPVAAVAAAVVGVGLAVSGIVALPLALAGMAVAYGATLLVSSGPEVVTLESAEGRERRLRRRLEIECARISDLAPHRPVHGALRELRFELESVLQLSAASTISDGSFDVARIIDGYVPTALDSYLRIPEARVLIELEGGRSPQGILLDQLQVMRTGAQRAATALTSGDVQALLAQERFLKGRFEDDVDQLAPEGTRP